MKLPPRPGIRDGLTRPAQPKATSMRRSQVVAWPLDTLDASTLVHVTVHPACGCVWGWSLDGTALDPHMERRLMLADAAQSALITTTQHHVTLGRFHVLHRDLLMRVAASEVDNPERIDFETGPV